MIVETDASDHALVAILSTQVNGDIHPVAFHSQTFNTTESNYDIHDKELLAIFEVFKRWQHYLEGTPSPVEVFTDHKNLMYFCESKTLSCCQARWSEFLSQFNLTIKFRPGRLGAKPDALMRRWDVYNKEESNKLTNRQPIFSQDQLNPNPPTEYPTLRAASMLDTRSLLLDIKMAVAAKSSYTARLKAKGDPNNPRWSMSDNGLLLYDEQILYLNPRTSVYEYFKQDMTINWQDIWDSPRLTN